VVASTPGRRAGARIPRLARARLLKIEDVREKRAKLEEYLDRGDGECHLREPRIAKLCEDALLLFQNERYELQAPGVMPNHVHVLVHVWRTPLWKIVQNWKIRVENQARRIQLPERPSSAWARGQAQRERAEAVLGAPMTTRTLGYLPARCATGAKVRPNVQSNPVKAKSCRAAEERPYLSARFRDQYMSGGSVQFSDHCVSDRLTPGRSTGLRSL
jgi:hypothetical protein